MHTVYSTYYYCISHPVEAATEWIGVQRWRFTYKSGWLPLAITALYNCFPITVESAHHGAVHNNAFPGCDAIPSNEYFVLHIKCSEYNDIDYITFIRIPIRNNIILKLNLVKISSTNALLFHSRTLQI